MAHDNTNLQPTERPIDPALIEQVLLKGDLKSLKPEQKVSYYNRVCESLGLNPLTQPFAYITLNGKEVLYAKRDAAEQLRKVHNISITITAREVIEGVYIVTAQAKTPSGRTDESTGAVHVEGLKGENRANAVMKAETKAKRRVTLSICGLGMLDETEVETVADAQPFPAANAPRILPAEPQGFAEWWARLQGVADRGTAALEAAWKESPVEHRRYLTSVYPEKWNALKAIACGEVVHA